MEHASDSAGWLGLTLSTSTMCRRSAQVARLSWQFQITLLLASYEGSAKVSRRPSFPRP